MLIFMNREEVIFMSKKEFKSSLSKYFQAYHDEQVALCLSVRDKLMRLHVFDNYFFKNETTPIFLSETVVNEMLDYLVNEEKRDRYRYTSTFAMFAKYLVRLGVPCYIPSVGRMPKSNYLPYIYSHEEIGKIFIAADSLRNKKHSNKSILMIMPVLIRLLYSTAIRLGEALSLQNKDVDFEHHTITLNNTKNGCQRIAPINTSMEKVLRQYIDYRNKLQVKNIAAPDSPFFVNLLGQPCTNHAVLTRFVEILHKAGIEYKGNHLGPRIHDLRHTACVHTMIKMSKEGKDIYCTLPNIAAYMGHRDYSSTNKYLRLSKEMFPDIVNLSYNLGESLDTTIYKNVKFDEYYE